MKTNLWIPIALLGLSGAMCWGAMCYRANTRAHMHAHAAVITHQRDGAIVIDANSLSNLADASDAINDVIKQAVSRHIREVDLPAGNFTLYKSIVIPDNAHDFALVGAGSARTVFSTSVPINEAVKAGRICPSFNNWGFGPKQTTNVSTATIHEGDTWIQLNDRIPYHTGAHYLIYDNSVVQQSKGTQAQNNRRELVRAIAYDSGQNRIQLDHPAARDYDLGPTLSYVEPFTCENLTIRGIGIDARAIETKRSSGFTIGLTDGLTLDDLSVSNFSTRSISCQMDRNVSLTNSVSRNGAHPEWPGSGYGPTFWFSRFVKVSNCLSDACRHGFVNENGSSDIRYENCQVTGNNGNFDSHGFDEMRVSYVNCTCTGGLNVGNENWLGGAREITAQDCTFTNYVLFMANTRDCHLTHCKTGQLRLASASNTPGIPPSGQADNITFTDCSFTHPTQVILAKGTSGVITLDHCSLEQSGLNWGSIAKLDEFTGNLVLNQCKIVTRNQKGYAPFSLTTPGDAGQLTLHQCSIESDGDPAMVVDLGQNTSARVSLVGNTFSTRSRNVARLVRSLGPSQVEETGSQVNGRN